jgi:hypothetical protein
MLDPTPRLVLGQIQWSGTPPSDLRRRFTLGLQSFRASGFFYDKELKIVEEVKSEGLEGLTSVLFSQI